MKKMITFILVLCMILTIAACTNKDNTPENTTPATTTPAETTTENTTPTPEDPTEITLQEIYEVGKNYIALLGDHENLFITYEYNGSGIRQDFYSKEYYHTFTSSEYYGWGEDYETFITKNAEYYYSEGAYSFDIMLALDGIINAQKHFDEAGKTPFMEFDATKEENATIVQQDGLLIVTYTNDQEDLAEFGDNIVSLVETYTLDATALEIISVTVLYTYDDGSTLDGCITIARDVEAPDRVEEFLKFENETDLRTVTVVSNPGTEDEKTDTVQAPKGLMVDIYSHWDIEETLTLYTDAACTQIFEGDTDFDADITVYTKWEEYIPEDEIRYTVTQEEWDAAVAETNFTLERIEDGESLTVQKYTDYALDIDGSIFIFIGDKTYDLVEEEDGWFAYDCTYLEFSITYLLDGCDMADFEYDEEEQAYLYKYWEDYGYTVAIQFENGLPVSMTLVNIEDESNVILRLFTNVGTTVIDLPEYEIVEDEEDPIPSTVTEEVWNSYVGKTNFDYVIMLTGFVNSNFYTELHYVKSTGNALLVDDVIYVLENGKYYILEETADGWIATESTLPAFCLTSLLEGLNYNDYEFYKATGYYVPKETVENEPYKEVVFDENGNLIYIAIYNDNLSENPETEGLTLPSMIAFNDVGNTVIDVPAYTIVE